MVYQKNGNVKKMRNKKIFKHIILLSLFGFLFLYLSFNANMSLGDRSVSYDPTYKICASADQVIDIHFVDPEDDVVMRNLTSGAILQENITYPDYDITNVTVTTGPENYTLTLYIKGNFNFSDDDGVYRYNVKLFWEWRMLDPLDDVASWAHGYEFNNGPGFEIEDGLLGNKNHPEAASFDNGSHAFTCTFNRSWIANQDNWGIPIDTFWVDAEVKFQYWVGTDYVIEFKDDLTNGYYETQSNDLLPEANFTATPTSIEEGETVTFTYTGTDGDGITSYQWNFGDGTANSTAENPTHAFNTKGTYTVTLTVNDTDGDASTKIMAAYITVTEDPGGTNGGEIPGYPVAMILMFTCLGFAIWKYKWRTK